MWDLPTRIEDYWLKNKNQTLFDILNFVLSPKENGFKLVKSGTSLPKDREVWFHDKAVLVYYDLDNNSIYKILH